MISMMDDGRWSYGIVRPAVLAGIERKSSSSAIRTKAARRGSAEEQVGAHQSVHLAQPQGTWLLLLLLLHHQPQSCSQRGRTCYSLRGDRREYHGVVATDAAGQVSANVKEEEVGGLCCEGLAGAPSVGSHRFFVAEMEVAARRGQAELLQNRRH